MGEYINMILGAGLVAACAGGMFILLRYVSIWRLLDTVLAEKGRVQAQFIALRNEVEGKDKARDAWIDDLILPCFRLDRQGGEPVWRVNKSFLELTGIDPRRPDALKDLRSRAFIEVLDSLESTCPEIIALPGEDGQTRWLFAVARRTKHPSNHGGATVEGFFADITLLKEGALVAEKEIAALRVGFGEAVRELDHIRAALAQERVDHQEFSAQASRDISSLEECVKELGQHLDAAKTHGEDLAHQLLESQNQTTHALDLNDRVNAALNSLCAAAITPENRASALAEASLTLTGCQYALVLRLDASGALPAVLAMAGTLPGTAAALHEALGTAHAARAFQQETTDDAWTVWDEARDGTGPLGAMTSFPMAILSIAEDNEARISVILGGISTAGDAREMAALRNAVQTGVILRRDALSIVNGMTALESEKQTREESGAMLTCLVNLMRDTLPAADVTADMLARNPLSGAQRQELETLRRVTGDAMGKVQRLASLAILRDGFWRTSPSIFDLQELLGDTLSGEGIPIIIDDVTPRHVEADAFLFHWLFQCLRAFAVSRCSGPERRLKVSILAPRDARPSPDGRALTLMLQLDGLAQQSINLDTAPFDALPMRLIHTLAGLLDGEVSIASGPPPALLLRLPVRAIEKVSPGTAPSAVEPLKPMSILLATGTEAGMDVLITDLMSEGHAVVSVQSLEQAISMLRLGHFDMLMLAVTPGRATDDLARRIRSSQLEGVDPAMPVAGLVPGIPDVAPGIHGLDVLIPWPALNSTVLRGIRAACARHTPGMARLVTPSAPPLAPVMGLAAPVTSALPVLDTGMALKQLNGRRDLLERLLHLFLTSAPGMASEASAALERQDMDSVRHSLDQLGTQARHAGARQLQAVIEETQAALAQGQIPPLRHVLREALDPAIEAILEVLGLD